MKGRDKLAGSSDEEGEDAEPGNEQEGENAEPDEALCDCKVIAVPMSER